MNSLSSQLRSTHVDNEAMYLSLGLDEEEIEPEQFTKEGIYYFKLVIE